MASTTSPASTDPLILSVRAKTLRTALRSVAPFMSKDASTPALMGIHLRLGSKRLVAGATDRHVLGQYVIGEGDLAPADGSSEDEMSIILAAADVKTLVGTLGTKSSPEVTLFVAILADGAVALTATTKDGNSVTFAGLEGAYPDFRRLIPQDVRHDLSEPIALGADLLAKISAAGKALMSSTAIKFEFQGPLKPVRLSATTDLRWSGLVMPFRLR